MNLFERVVEDNELEEEFQVVCPDCGSEDIQTFFDPDTSMNGESQYCCKDCGREF